MVFQKALQARRKSPELVPPPSLTSSSSYSRPSSLIKVVASSSSDQYYHGGENGESHEEGQEQEIHCLVQPTPGTTIRIVSPDGAQEGKQKEPRGRLRTNYFFGNKRKNKKQQESSSSSLENDNSYITSQGDNRGGEDFSYLSSAGNTANNNSFEAEPIFDAKLSPIRKTPSNLHLRPVSRSPPAQRGGAKTPTNLEAQLDQIAADGDHDVNTSRGGYSAGLFTEGSAVSKTQVAGNLTMAPSFMLFSTLISLSLMRVPTAMETQTGRSLNDEALRQEAKNGTVKLCDSTISAADSLLMLSSSRTVRESVERHFQYHLAKSQESNNAVEMKTGTVATAAENYTSSWNQTPSYSLDSASLFSNLPKTERPGTNTTARNLLLDGDIDGAISVYKGALLRKDQVQAKLISFAAADDRQMDTLERVDNLSKLSVLYLYANRYKDAMDTMSEASRLVGQDNPLKETRPLQSVMISMGVGLIHLANNDVAKALGIWQQAIKSCYKAVGFDHPIVAVLLNNLAVLHYEMGESLKAKAALEESLGLQKSLLKVSNTLDAEYALYQMGTSMSNLAMVLEVQEEFGSAINLLQEAQTMYESVEGDNQDDDDENGDKDSVFGTAESVKAPPIKDTRDTPRIRMQDVVGHHVERLNVVRNVSMERKARNAKKISIAMAGQGLKTPDAAANSFEEQMQVKEDKIIASLAKENSPGPNAKRVRLRPSDLHDYVLLGTLRGEWTPRERVRETVLAWFDMRSDRTSSKSSISFPGSTYFGITAGAKTQLFRNNPEEDKNTSFTSDGSDSTSPFDIPSEKTRACPTQKDPIDLVEVEFSNVRTQIMALVADEKLERAIETCRSTLDRYKATLCVDHPLAGTALHMLGMLLVLAEEYSGAYSILTEAVRVRKAAHGRDDMKVVHSLTKLALLQYAAMNIPASGRTLGEIRSSCLKTMGFGHPHLAQIMNTIGVLRYEQGDIAASIRALEIGYEYQRKIVEEGADSDGDEVHYKVAQVAMAYTLSNIAFMYYQSGNQVGSLRLFEEAKSILSRHAPSEDRVMLLIEENIEALVGKGIPSCEEKHICVGCSQAIGSVHYRS